MRVLLAVGVLLLAGCKQQLSDGVADAGSQPPAPSGATPIMPTRLEWAAVQSQGVFASALAARGRREWVLVEPQPPNTLIVHLIPIDTIVNMPALQQQGNALKAMWKPDRDGWSPEIEVRIEAGGAASR